MAFPIIYAEELKEEIENPDIFVIDIRGSMGNPAIGSLLFEKSHLPGAVKLEFSTDLISKPTQQSGRSPLPERNTIEEKLRRLGLTRHSRVVIYDDGRLNLAPRAWFTLRWLGHDAVQVLEGGFEHWKNLGYPLTDAVTTRATGDFTASEPLVRVFTTKEIRDNLELKQYQLIDARAEEVFNGESAGLDAKAGHIPGSLSHPNADNVTPEGHIRDLTLIKDDFLSLSQMKPETIIHTCGSGVAACGNLLVTEAAGLKTAGIYVGSFSEWIRNDENPIEI